MEEMGDDLWYALKEERVIEKMGRAPGRFLSISKGEAAGEAALQEATGEGEVRAVP